MKLPLLVAATAWSIVILCTAPNFTAASESPVLRGARSATDGQIQNTLRNKQLVTLEKGTTNTKDATDYIGKPLQGRRLTPPSFAKGPPDHSNAGGLFLEKGTSSSSSSNDSTTTTTEATSTVATTTSDGNESEVPCSCPDDPCLQVDQDSCEFDIGSGDPVCDTAACVPGDCPVDGLCVQCSGDLGQPCCSDSICVPVVGAVCSEGTCVCGDGLVENEGICVPECGGDGQPCCSTGLLCTDPTLVCFGDDESDTESICVPPPPPPCGELGLPCCNPGPDSTCSSETLVCFESDCVECGDPGQPCCSNSSCNPGPLTCDPLSSFCVLLPT